VPSLELRRQRNRQPASDGNFSGDRANGGTLSTRYVVVYDKVRRGSAVMFVLEDPRNSTADADFFDSMVASAKLLK